MSFARKLAIFQNHLNARNIKGSRVSKRINSAVSQEHNHFLKTLKKKKQRRILKGMSDRMKRILIWKGIGAWNVL